MDNFFSVRDQFYEQRQRLTQILNEDLDRLDYDRKAEFMRKFRAFHVGKDAAFVDDIAIMRHKAAIQRKAEKTRILRQHPWYFELLNKVQTSSVNGHLKEMEQLLLDRIRW
ncbi:hypothetical protein HDU96_007930 [Phlyctochytrium bullatum]|nr:hypothetical protein HDU96_007930 [Phlyctochytrium bullatum]